MKGSGQQFEKFAKKKRDVEPQFPKFAKKRDPGRQFENFARNDLEQQFPKFAKKKRSGMTIWKICKKGIWNSNSKIANEGHCTVE